MSGHLTCLFMADFGSTLFVFEFANKIVNKMHWLFIIFRGRQPHAFEEELLVVLLYPVYYLGSSGGIDRRSRARNTKMFFPLSVYFSVVQHFLAPVLQTRIYPQELL